MKKNGRENENCLLLKVMNTEQCFSLKKYLLLAQYSLCSLKKKIHVQKTKTNKTTQIFTLVPTKHKLLKTQ